jgi:uncharacterized OsmC-like protein
VTQALPETRVYLSSAESTGTFGRVLCSTRDQHWVVDGPVQNGCPGEAPTPGEIFLAGVAACGVELIQVLARREDIPLQSLSADIEGMIDYTAPVRPDVTLFNRVRLRFAFQGVTDEQAAVLVDRFKQRCPLYGSVSVACPDVQVGFLANP